MTESSTDIVSDADAAHATAGEPPAPGGDTASQRVIDAWRRYVPDVRPGEVDRLLPIVRSGGPRISELVRAYRAGVADARAAGRAEW